MWDNKSPLPIVAAQCATASFPPFPTVFFLNATEVCSVSKESGRCCEILFGTGIELSGKTAKLVFLTIEQKHTSPPKTTRNSQSVLFLFLRNSERKRTDLPQSPPISPTSTHPASCCCRTMRASWFGRSCPRHGCVLEATSWITLLRLRKCGKKNPVNHRILVLEYMYIYTYIYICRYVYTYIRLPGQSFCTYVFLGSILFTWIVLYFGHSPQPFNLDV